MYAIKTPAGRFSSGHLLKNQMGIIVFESYEDAAFWLQEYATYKSRTGTTDGLTIVSLF